MSITADNKPKNIKAKSRHWVMFLPIGGFAGLAALFYFTLYAGDPSTIPSVLIDKPAPQFALPALDGLKRDGQAVPGVQTADLRKGRLSVVNIWASWCGPCRLEHPYLMQMAASGKANMVGLNYKDLPENARRFLGVHGNPYTAVGVDKAGRTSVDWGVYGVPETFVVDGAGKIIFKHIGPINKNIYQTKFLPLLNGSRP